MAVPCVKLDKVNGIFSVCTFTVINLHYLDFHLAINVRKFGVLEFSAFKKFSQSLNVLFQFYSICKIIMKNYNALQPMST